jgi:hypothetical protein
MYDRFKNDDFQFGFEIVLGSVYRGAALAASAAASIA